jgi:hypothetical protein
MRRRRLIVLFVALILTRASAAFALPTMVRLGYTGCATCHLAPQGGGPMNPYGRAIDEAQSLRAGEYRPRDTKLVRALSWDGRVAQDLRVLFPMQRTWAAHDPVEGSLRARLQYRNFTQLPGRFAVHVMVTGETEAASRPVRLYDPAFESSSPVLNVALVRYRAAPGLEISAGRDQLPVGVNVPDSGLFFKARNRIGFYDAPTQIKAHWEGKRHRVMPFAYAPGGNEPAGERESGGGAVADFVPFANHHAVLGIGALRGSSRNGSRQGIGAHARLGFGAWGILAQHDVTSRDRDNAGSFRQHASYTQVFWAVREWLVASAIGERLSVQAPFEERRTGGALEIAARLTSVATIGASGRAERDALTGRVSRSLTFQLTLKTVY